MDNSSQTLKNILNQAEEQSRRGLSLPVFFDLDSTLFDVSPRISRILHDFAREPEVAQKYPKEAALLLTVEPAPGDWGVKRTLDRYGFQPPGEEFIKKLVGYWKTHFFSSGYLKHDRPYEGAQAYLKQLEKVGASIAYLSGRDVPRMKEGSVEVLQYHGFPLKADASNLYLKPSTAQEDHDFKVAFLKSNCQADKGPAWFFENEPAIIHPVLEQCPHIHIVFVDTVHSEAAPLPPDHVSRIKSYI